MSINSKDKGAKFERTLAGMFREYGYDAHRTAQYCGKTGQAADVNGLPYVSVEAKARKEIAVYKWMEQAVRDAKAAGKGDKPVVFMKENYGEVLVLLRFEDFMEIYAEWEASESFKREQNEH